MSKTLELEKYLGEENPISEFNRKWINNSPNSIEQMWQTYCLLRFHRLSRDKIASQAHLLGRDPETIERNYKRLSDLGLKDDKIASQAQLLGMNPETIERNYQSHIKLLRQEYNNRKSGKDLLTNQAHLLGISPETIEANVQFLNNLGMNYNSGTLLGTTAQLKRKKMAWLLREVFDFRNSKDKKQTIYNMHEFVKKNPQYLVKSVSTLEKTKDKIKNPTAASCGVCDYVTSSLG